MRIAIVQGTRPEIIKNYSIVKALRQRGAPFEVLHTGQHSSPRMSGDIYDDMGYLPTRTFAAPYRLGSAIDWLQSTFRKDRITHVLVNGDTAASIAGALAAMDMDIEVSHVEAGLRSRDRYMPEERNRIMVDAIASSLFAYTSFEMDVLRKSPDIRGKLYLEGNTTVDLLNDFAGRIDQPTFHGRYLFVTAHRKEFTESKEKMEKVFSILERIASEVCPVVFPIHPRTLDAVTRFGLRDDIFRSINLLDPLRTLDSLAAIKHAAAVVTDSGCIQEEAYILGVPCVTIRNNTERQLTVSEGANRVSGFEPASILDAVHWALDLQERNWPAIYGSPGAGSRIVDCITANMLDPDALPDLSCASL